MGKIKDVLYPGSLAKRSAAGDAVADSIAVFTGNIAINQLRPKQQMPMVTHNAITANPHIDPLKPFSENRFKSLEIGILTKNTQSAISTIDNVINVAA